MNKSYKSVFNRSTGTYVAASENVKSVGKSAKNKLAMKVATASLAFGTSIAMMSPMSASADEGAQVDMQALAQDPADEVVTQFDEVVSVPAADDSSLPNNVV